MRTALAVGSVLVSTAAFGADVAAPAAVDVLSPVPAAYNWTGFHLGASVGGGISSGNSSFSTVGGPTFARAGTDASGVVGGFQAGYDWQFGQVVFGVETDFQFSGVEGSLRATCPAGTCGATVNARYSQKMPWFGTVRGRIGYAADGFLVYATGGYAYGETKIDGRARAPGVNTGFDRSEVRSGWTLGGGIAVGLTRNVSLKLEYDYVDLGSMTGRVRVPGLPALRYDSRFSENIVRAGVDYRF